MSAPTAESLGRYLEALKGRPVRVLDVVPLRNGAQTGGENGGVPLRIDYEIGGRRQRAVLETLRAAPGGLETAVDRAQVLLWDQLASNRLPKHVRALDVGALERGGKLLSLGRAEEFFVLKDCADGRDYAADLAVLAENSILTDLDTSRCDALCDYLLAIHREPGPDPSLYVRRVRELIGHGGGIMGLTDGAVGAASPFTAVQLEDVERRAVAWRWRIRSRGHRLRQVHGNFRPTNVLFRDGCDFTVLGRARGQWGEPVDDLACLTLHYVASGLDRSGAFEGPLKALFRRFWATYLEQSGDGELLEVAPPFLAVRGLELILRDPGDELPETVRRALAAFVVRVLNEPAFDPEQIDAYLAS